MLNTNNGVERQNRILKHDYLSSQREKTLSATIRVIVTRYIPDSWKRLVADAETFLRISAWWRIWGFGQIYSYL